MFVGLVCVHSRCFELELFVSLDLFSSLHVVVYDCIDLDFEFRFVDKHEVVETSFPESLELFFVEVLFEEIFNLLFADLLI